MGMMGLDLVSEQMQYFFVNLPRVLADLEEVVAVRRKAGDIVAILIHPVFALVVLVMGVFSHLEMMHFLVHFDFDRVIFHTLLTSKEAICVIGNADY
jgi:hypothetical protein